MPCPGFSPATDSRDEGHAPASSSTLWPCPDLRGGDSVKRRQQRRRCIRLTSSVGHLRQFNPGQLCYLIVLSFELRRQHVFTLYPRGALLLGYAVAASTVWTQSWIHVQLILTVADTTTAATEEIIVLLQALPSRLRVIHDVDVRYKDRIPVQVGHIDNYP